jgi:hypothetical protein
MWWNCEGLGDTVKRFLIHEMVKKHRLDFVIVSETGRSNFVAPFFNHLSRGLDFMWYCLPPHGRSGGILVGINMKTISIQKVETRDFYTKLFVKNKLNGFKWILAGVYVVAQDALKPDFLAELVRICESETLPMLV